jgi:UDPglucose--hexose-1-phosphate uridylyltransferase
LSDIRQDPISGHWVIVAPERAKRDTDFSPEPPRVEPQSRCPFCPGHEGDTPPEVYAVRDSGAPNEPGWRVRVFPNLIPALDPESGIHEVIVESANHDGVLARATPAQLEGVLGAWQHRVKAAALDPNVRAAAIFKNSGPAAGATKQHPHSQLMAIPFVPERLAAELDAGRRLRESSGQCPWCHLVRDAGERTVAETTSFAALAPYASRFPYETWILPKSHESRFEECDTIADLAVALRETLGRLDRSLGHPPFNAALMTAPFIDEAAGHYHWRIEILPRLGGVGGFEWGTGCFINPVAPEEAARILRAVEMD